MKLNKALPAAALIAAYALCSAAVADTLRDAIDQAIHSNPEVLASASRRLQAGEGVKQARAGYLPRVDVTLGRGREWLDSPDTRIYGVNDQLMTRREASVTLTQMLFDGFAVRSEVKRQEARVASTSYNVAATAEDLALRVVTAYLEVLRREETVAEAQDNLDAHERISRQIRTLAEGGVGRRADIDQAETRLALARASLRQEQSSLRDAQTSYLRLVGKAPNALEAPALPDALLPDSEARVIDEALHAHPSVKAAEANVALASAANAGAKAALSPRVDLELASSRSNDLVRGQVNDRSVMLRLRYNLFRAGADTARVAETGYQVQEAGEVLNQVRTEVRENAALAYNANVTARERIGDLERYVNASVATREAYQKQFSIGQRSLLDLLNSEGEVFNARQAYTTGKFALLAGGYRVLAGMGELVRGVGVAPPPGMVGQKAPTKNVQ
ncbi:TolC family outer membrane protein [Noviherbaspirillum pedocola]|uniref:TolC family outer membrane protein n=1 Tax=Noviherbaspirillum pedocola TaxID=2801341 RepID=A0A934SW77_9BURK|nr:TolC family outer membrane protein [Noviherbaspirillum pedocola]MBK4733829.1 TolC family outer membrane protein [Noviherbaspirillum pedocola]